MKCVSHVFQLRNTLLVNERPTSKIWQDPQALKNGRSLTNSLYQVIAHSFCNK